MPTISDELAQVRTKKKEFLEQMERVIPWDTWMASVKPCYYKGKRGSKPYTLELMVRINTLQNLHSLADEAAATEIAHQAKKGNE